MIAFIEEMKNDPRFIDRASFAVRDDLHPKFWFTDNLLNPKVKEKLLEISDDFIEGLDLDVSVKDVTFTGSLSNYTWSKYSDIDLHIVIDFAEIDKDDEFLSDYFNAKKSVWNRKHNIMIYGFEVEIYVQNMNEEHHSTGVYSLLRGKWLEKPEKESASIDWYNVKDKAFSLMDQIDRIPDLLTDEKFKEAYDYSMMLRDKIRKFRQTGLETVGAFSSENIAFKALRRNGYLEKLSSTRDIAYDKLMSLTGGGVKIKVSEMVENWKDFLKEE